MNTSLIRPEIGQWYAHADKGQLFQVVGRDDESRTIEIQYFDGDVDEIDAETWPTLLIEPTEPPEDMTAPMDDIETDDLGYSETDMTEAEWREPLQPLRGQEESWEETEPEDERDALGEGRPAEPFAADVPQGEERVSVASSARATAELHSCQRSHAERGRHPERFATGVPAIPRGDEVIEPL